MKNKHLETDIRVASPDINPDDGQEYLGHRLFNKGWFGGDLSRANGVNNREIQSHLISLENQVIDLKMRDRAYANILHGLGIDLKSEVGPFDHAGGSRTYTFGREVWLIPLGQGLSEVRINDRVIFQGNNEAALAYYNAGSFDVIPDLKIKNEIEIEK